MSIGINDNILNQTFRLSAQNMHNAGKSKEGTAQFTIPDLDEEEAGIPFAVLPQGIGMNEEQFIAYQAARTAPIVFDFAALYEQFGIELKWTYDENGNRMCGMYDDTPANRAASVRMTAYMDQVSRERRSAP